MATVIIPTPLRKFTNNTSRITIGVRSVHEMMEKLSAEYPDLKRHLLDANGKIPSFINIFVDDDDIRNLQHENTPVHENSTVSIIPAIAGGAV